MYSVKKTLSSQNKTEGYIMQISFILLDDLTYNAIRTVQIDDTLLDSIKANGNFARELEVSFLDATVFGQSSCDAHPVSDRCQFDWIMCTGPRSEIIANYLHQCQVTLFGAGNYNMGVGCISNCHYPTDLHALCRDIATFLDS